MDCQSVSLIRIFSNHKRPKTPPNDKEETEIYDGETKDDDDDCAYAHEQYERRQHREET